ncbi:lysophospholipid acyltransferase family protein [Kushneria aurantia]|uniref:Lysophospholipid acyltransferase family protein n=1 Tax=Kushneria aurantia TaxID=504092 RepID=A0ABV6G5Y1_9GAMM|nr:lysophospholipid acyltransferase family protein [Kushneria aurantia]
MKLLRSLLFYAGYLLAITVGAFTLLPLALVLPLGGRFRVLNLYNRFIVAWFGLCCGVRYRIEGRDNIPDGAVVMLANHQSEWETLFLQTLKMPLCTVLKQELLRIPVFGWGLRLLKPIPLDRSKPSKALRQVLSEGAERLSQGLSVLLFPEGTRVPPGQRRRFNKSGVHIACRAGVPVLPIAHNAGEHWPGHGVIKHPGQIRVVIGAPIATAERSPEAVTRDVEQWIETQLARISEVPRPVEAASPGTA